MLLGVSSAQGQTLYVATNGATQFTITGAVNPTAMAVTPVPEPGAWPLVTAGLGLLGGTRWRVRRGGAVVTD